MAAQTAKLLGKLTDKDIERIKNLLIKAKLPVKRPERMTIESYIPHMLRDKKVLSGQIRLVLPTKIGAVEVIDVVDKQLILEAISSI